MHCQFGVKGFFVVCRRDQLIRFAVRKDYRELLSPYLGQAIFHESLLNILLAGSGLFLLAEISHLVTSDLYGFLF